MAKKFNTAGLCLKDRHYMVDTSDKISAISKMVDEGDYFVINRARQYGKTTTLNLLTEALVDKYIVFSLSFEGIGDSFFENEALFCRGFCHLMEQAVKYGETKGLGASVLEKLQNIGKEEKHDFLTFSAILSEMCNQTDKPVILIIDEVDQASNHKIFLDFLGLLRSKYLKREKRPTFQSVILAGIYDVKNLKLKIREDREQQFNSPWNIAVDFLVDMSFCKEKIADMLEAYEVDYTTGMNIEQMSAMIYDYTAGYPYLVSRLCMLMDERVIGMEHFTYRAEVWTKQGVQEALKLLLNESNALFDDMLKKMADYPELKLMMQNILFCGERYSFNPYDFVINLGNMLGFLKEKNSMVVIANRIFETLMYNLFISSEETSSEMYKVGTREKSQFIKNGHLQMDIVMKKFMEHFTEIYADAENRFIEANGRRIFLIYLKPIINGSGNYYIEAQTRDMKRTDVIVDYHGNQFIIELKIWHGEEYNARGEKQLFEYLDYYKKEKGYLLSFDFNQNKKPKMQEIIYQEKKIVEVVV